jgi:hypothetical protein
MNSPTIIVYLRAGRKKRGTGEILAMGAKGMLKVRPRHEGWGPIWLTPEEIAAGKDKPPPIPREKPIGPRKPSMPKPPPAPRHVELLALVRRLEIDHHPQGWPAVKMETLTALADELEAALGLFAPQKTA